MQATTAGGVLIEMLAERAPFLAVALIVAVAVSSFAHRPHRVTVAKRDADAAASLAVKDAQAAKDELDQLLHMLDVLDNQIAHATDAVVAADNDADRAAAKARLEQLLQEQHDITMCTARARALAFRPERLKYLYLVVPGRCVNDPLAKGCS